MIPSHQAGAACIVIGTAELVLDDALFVGVQRLTSVNGERCGRLLTVVFAGGISRD
jgi:hypothetical protein